MTVTLSLWFSDTCQYSWVNDMSFMWHCHQMNTTGPGVMCCFCLNLGFNSSNAEYGLFWLWGSVISTMPDDVLAPKVARASVGMVLTVGQITCIVVPEVIIPPAQQSCRGVYWFHSVQSSVHPSVRPSVRLSRILCPLCSAYSSGWIHFIFTHLI